MRGQETINTYLHNRTLVQCLCQKSYNVFAEVDAVNSALTECTEHRLLKSSSHSLHEANLAHGTCTSSLQPRCKHDNMAPYCWHIVQRWPDAVQTAASRPTMRVPMMCTPDDHTAQSPCIQTSKDVSLALAIPKNGLGLDAGVPEGNCAAVGDVGSESFSLRFFLDWKYKN